MTTRYPKHFESAKPLRFVAALFLTCSLGTMLWAQISGVATVRRTPPQTQEKEKEATTGATHQLPKLHRSIVTSLAPGQNSAANLVRPGQAQFRETQGDFAEASNSVKSSRSAVSEFQPPAQEGTRYLNGQRAVGIPLPRETARPPRVEFQDSGATIGIPVPNSKSLARDAFDSPKASFLGIRPRSGILRVRAQPAGFSESPAERVAMRSQEDDSLLPPGTDDWLFQDEQFRSETRAPNASAVESGEGNDLAAEYDSQFRQDEGLNLDQELKSVEGLDLGNMRQLDDLLPTPQVDLSLPIKDLTQGPREAIEAMGQSQSPAGETELGFEEASSPSDTPQWSELEYQQLRQRLPEAGVPDPAATQSGKQLEIEEVAQNIKSKRITSFPNAVPLGLSEVVALALQNSKNIHVQRIQPAEELQEVNKQFGQFDWQGFVLGSWAQQSDPVGNVVTQTNQNLTQVRNDNNDVQFGVRKSTLTGGQFELSETLATRDTNSGLLDPAEQGTAQMKITFSQELLRDGGRDIVLSQALIASLLADQTHAQSFAEVSTVLQNVLAQYWDLYQKRGNYFIQYSLMKWAEETLQLLESRGRIDAEKNSIEQARALLLEARADLRNAKTEVLISQDQLYRLINAPGIDSNQVEVLPIEEPRLTDRIYVLDEELQQAYTSRAEVAQKLLEIRTAAIEHHVSLNQLLPKLTFSIESSLNGLDGDKDFWGAKANLTDNDPSYQANINFEIFLGNRAARAANKQAQLALRRLQFEYEDQLEQVRLDVSTAIRGLNGSTSILDQRMKTLAARQEEIEYLRLRRDVIPQQDASPTLLLEQFFQAINRLVLSQQAYVEAVAAQQSAYVDLLQAKGVLLHGMEVPRDIGIGVPSLINAGHTQWHGKPGVVQPIQERVIVPGRKHRLPTVR